MEPEKVSKIFDEIKNRFASRFIFSFVIAWLINNWKITVALLWYDKSQFNGSGSITIFDFISNQLNNNNNHFNDTIFIALGYTFGLPISKSVINIWDEIILDLRNWSKTKLVRSQDAKTIIELNNKLNKIGDPKILNGQWTVISESRFYSSEKSFQIYIQDSIIFLYEGLEKKELGIISSFIYNINSNQIIFVIEKTKGYNSFNRYSDNFIVNILNFEKLSEGVFILKGTENGESITFKKFRE